MRCMVHNKIHNSYSEMEETLTGDLESVNTYFDDNRLGVNTDKCEFMQISTQTTHQEHRKWSKIHIPINIESLNQVSLLKYIGMFIDGNLKWDHHIDSMIKTISTKSGILRSLHKSYSYRHC